MHPIRHPQILLASVVVLFAWCDLASAQIGPPPINPQQQLLDFQRLYHTNRADRLIPSLLDGSIKPAGQPDGVWLDDLLQKARQTSPDVSTFAGDPHRDLLLIHPPMNAGVDALRDAMRVCPSDVGRAALAQAVEAMGAALALETQRRAVVEQQNVAAGNYLTTSNAKDLSALKAAASRAVLDALSVSAAKRRAGNALLGAAPWAKAGQIDMNPAPWPAGKPRPEVPLPDELQGVFDDVKNKAQQAGDETLLAELADLERKLRILLRVMRTRADPFFFSAMQVDWLERLLRIAEQLGDEQLAKRVRELLDRARDYKLFSEQPPTREEQIDEDVDYLEGQRARQESEAAREEGEADKKRARAKSLKSKVESPTGMRDIDNKILEEQKKEAAELEQQAREHDRKAEEYRKQAGETQKEIDDRLKDLEAAKQDAKPDQEPPKPPPAPQVDPPQPPAEAMSQTLGADEMVYIDATMLGAAPTATPDSRVDLARVASDLAHQLNMTRDVIQNLRDTIDAHEMLDGKASPDVISQSRDQMGEREAEAATMESLLRSLSGRM